MMPSRLPVLVALFLLLSPLGPAACGGGGADPDGGAPDASDPVVLDGGDAGTDTGDAGRPRPKPTDPENDTRDTDCDGLTDAEEFSRVYAGGVQTDPTEPDSDGDGVPDGVEAGRVSTPDPVCTPFEGDADPGTTTDPTQPDSDADGVPDGAEDANRNGRVDPGEGDPLDPDSDGDGLPDGCEDADGDGVVDPGETDPSRRDSDDDGLPDGVEDADRSCGREPGETDPTDPDSDGDGLPDGAEDLNGNGRLDPGETDPTVADVDSDGDGITDQREASVTGTDPDDPDSDDDGLQDGLEDRDQDGVRDATETGARHPDTDCDGLADGAEDTDHDGSVDDGETDPLDADTDADGLFDGLEAGAVASPAGASCPAFQPDLDPGTTTDPLDPDTDGDGILDGAEDRNQNGRVDGPQGDQPGEQDPAAPGDADPVVAEACSTTNLVPVTLRAALGGDLQLATRTTFDQATTLLAPGPVEVGLLGLDSTAQVGVAAVGRTSAGSTIEDDELAALDAFRALGAVENRIRSSFTTWDGFPAVRGTFDWSPGRDLMAASDRWADTVRPGVTGGWGRTAGIPGPFAVAFSVVRRSPGRAVYLMALAPRSLLDESQRIALDDLAGGSALSQVGDAAGVQCDAYVTQANQLVDFLYVIDNSGSMSEEQQALQGATAETVAQLQNSTLDWRIGVITTEYYDRPSFDGFTRDLATFESRTVVGTGGSGAERGLLSAQSFLQSSLHGGQVRADAKVVVVVISDEDESLTADEDVTDAQARQLADWFASEDVSVNGLICPPGEENGQCYSIGREGADQYALAIDRLGGVRGNVQDLGNIGPTISAVLSAAGASVSPYALARPPIATTLRVALEGDAGVVRVPRSRRDGFDYDPARNTLTLFGDYRPEAGRRLAVSYRSWRDLTPDPDRIPCGGPCPEPLVCNPETDTCECPADCGTGGPPGPDWTCDPVACEWACPVDCGGTCSGYESCDTASCGCTCRQSVTCAAGFRFDEAACGCVCDAGQFECEGNRAFDAEACACVCPQDCGGACVVNEFCRTSTCECVSSFVP